MFEFKTNVLDRSHSIPVLVEFSTPSCGPCWWMEKTLIEVVRDMEGKLEFVSLPIEAYGHLAETYKLKSNPTSLLFINGIEIGRLKGALPAMVVKQWIEDQLETSE
jgi:thioredoxin-like negative regulator of GroEL